MRIQYCSDLHLEFEQNNKYLTNNPIPIIGEILILAGDIVPLHDNYLNDFFFNYISTNFKKVFWVPGNHEFYHRDLIEFNSSYCIPIKKNIEIVNNVDIIIDDIHFIFSTLWSKIDTQNSKSIEQGVADFDCIEVNNKKFRVNDFNKLHEESLNFIQQSLQNEINKTIVVTHHLPSNLCNSAIHNHSPINQAFCVDLTPFIENCNANFWIYGHSHFNQKPVYIGNTILLTNQLGYVQNNEHLNFKNNAYFSI